jgi:Fe-S cluster biogenesis protein NfuA
MNSSESKSKTGEFQNRIARIEELIHAIEAIPDEIARAQTHELVQALLELHGRGLNRSLEITYESGLQGESLINKLAEDDLVSSLLLLHGLHPLDLESRVRNALDKVGPRLAQHGGRVELLVVTPEGAVKLRLAGNCQGCPSSILTLKFSIEEAIYAAAPDVTSLEVEGTTPLEPTTANGAKGAIPVVPKYTECPLPAGGG